MKQNQREHAHALSLLRSFRIRLRYGLDDLLQAGKPVTLPLRILVGRLYQLQCPLQNEVDHADLEALQKPCGRKQCLDVLGTLDLVQLSL
jgi:hypothetical protein